MSSCKNINLLLLEDSLVYSKFIKTLFENCENYIFDITSIRSVAELTSSFTKKDYDVLLLDLGLSDSCGTDTLVKVKHLTGDVPVIVLTSSNENQVIEAVMAYGADDCIIKQNMNSFLLINSLLQSIEKVRIKKFLRKKELELEEAQRNLNSLIYRIYHDLQGPVASISGVTQLASMEFNEGRVLEYFMHIDKSNFQLQSRLKKLMSLSNINELGTDLEEIDFLEEEEEITTELKRFKDYGSVHFNWDVAVQRKIYSNKCLIKCILQQLLENCIHFRSRSEQSWVIVEIRDTLTSLAITIEDNGIGIPIEYQKRVFDIFFRGSPRSIGAGVGLYLVKCSVEKLDGTIHLESTPSEGTRITVTFPV